MRFVAITLVSLLAGIVSSQVPPGLPNCAGDCIGGLGGCGQLDVECICSNKPLLDDLACCVSKKCDKADQQTTIEFAQGICTGAGVDDIPTEATCAGSSSGSSSSSSSSSSSANAAATKFFEKPALGLVVAGVMAAL